MAAIVRQSKFILADVVANNNKFWNIIWTDDNTVETRWGRVGDTGQSKSFPHSSDYAAERFFDSKCREKEKKGYQPLQVIDAEIDVSERTSMRSSVDKAGVAAVATKQISSGCKETEKLVTYLAEKNVHNILSSTAMSYDANRGTFSTPLGIVTQSAITEARDLLSSMGGYVDKQDWDNTLFPPLVNRYMMLIPQALGRHRPNLRYRYPDLDSIQKQNAILDSLEASLQMVLSTPDSEKPKEEEKKLFDVSLSLIEQGKIIDWVRKKYKETWQTIHVCHHLDVKKIYGVKLGTMEEAFESESASMDNIWDLWHGTRVSNVLSIMSKGLVIPPSNASHCTGRMFGNGAYFSDQSTKSLNYAYGYWGGGGRDDNCFMFIFKVAMGKYYTPKSYSEQLPKAGYDSTYAVGGQSGVSNNEMIVYKTSQCKPVYLIEFSPGGR